MPKVHEMMESKYLKKEDVGRGVLATVSHLDRVNVAMKGEAPEHKWVIYFQELEKGLVLNATNIQLCERAFQSDDTDQWVGKPLVLYTDDNVSFGGQIVGGIRVRAPRNQAMARAAQGVPQGQAQVAPHSQPQGPQYKTPGGKFDDMVDDIPF